MANSINFDLELSIKQFQNSLDKVEKNFKNVTNSVTANSNVMKTAFAGFAGVLSGAAVISFARNVVGMGQSLVSAAADMQELELQLSILTGSMDVAKTLMEDINDLSTRTPFTPKDLVQASKTMIGFGIETDKVVGHLDKLSDISAISKGNINDLATVFGKINAEGKVTAERFDTLVTNGLNLKSVFADELGIAVKDVGKAMADGAVTTDIFLASIAKVTSEGGQYFQGAAKSSQTLSGQWSTLVGNAQLLAAEVGGPLVDALTELIKKTNEWYTANKEILKQQLSKAIKPFVDILKGLDIQSINDSFLRFATFLGHVLENMNSLYFVTKLWIGSRLFKVVKDITTVFIGLRAAIAGAGGALAFLGGPLGLLISIGGSLAAAFIPWEKVISGIVDKVNELASAGQKPKLDEFLYKERLKLAVDYSKRIAIAEKQGDDERAARLRLEQKEVLDEIRAYQIEKDKEAQISIQKKKEELDKKKELNLAHQKELLDLERLQNENINLINQEHNIELRALDTEYATLSIEERKLRQDQEITDRRDFEIAKIELVRNAELEKAKIQDTEEKRTLAKTAANNKANLAIATANSKANINLKRNEFKAKKDLGDQEQRLQEGYLQAASGFLQAGLILAKKGSKERKALAIADTTINTYAGATRALKDFPAPASYLVAASVVAAGLANVAKITSTGNFATGGIIPGTSVAGDRLTANVNSGEMILNKQQQAQLFQIANGQGGNNDALIERLDRLESAIISRPVVLVADDNEIARSASRGVQNGIEIGRSR